MISGVPFKEYVCVDVIEMCAASNFIYQSILDWMSRIICFKYNTFDVGDSGSNSWVYVEIGCIFDLH